MLSRNKYINQIEEENYYHNNKFLCLVKTQRFYNKASKECGLYIYIANAISKKNNSYIGYGISSSLSKAKQKASLESIERLLLREGYFILPSLRYYKDSFSYKNHILSLGVSSSINLNISKEKALSEYIEKSLVWEDFIGLTSFFKKVNLNIKAKYLNFFTKQELQLLVFCSKKIENRYTILIIIKDKNNNKVCHSSATHFTSKKALSKAIKESILTLCILSNKANENKKLPLQKSQNKLELFKGNTYFSKEIKITSNNASYFFIKAIKFHKDLKKQDILKYVFDIDDFYIKTNEC